MLTTIIAVAALAGVVVLWRRQQPAPPVERNDITQRIEWLETAERRRAQAEAEGRK